MDDNLDRANEEAEIGLAQALQLRKPEGPKATGECFWCDAPTILRWCSPAHRDAWEVQANHLSRTRK